MILLLVGFRQTSSDIKTRATATRPHGDTQSLPTVNFRTNPDLITTVDQQMAAPKVTFGSLDGTSSGSESQSKLGGFKAEVVGLDTRVSINSEKNV